MKMSCSAGWTSAVLFRGQRSAAEFESSSSLIDQLPPDWSHRRSPGKGRGLATPAAAARSSKPEAQVSQLTASIHPAEFPLFLIKERKAALFYFSLLI